MRVIIKNIAIIVIGAVAIFKPELLILALGTLGVISL